MGSKTVWQSQVENSKLNHKWSTSTNAGGNASTSWESKILRLQKLITIMYTGWTPQIKFGGNLTMGSFCGNCGKRVFRIIQVYFAANIRNGRTQCNAGSSAGADTWRTAPTITMFIHKCYCSNCEPKKQPCQMNLWKLKKWVKTQVRLAIGLHVQCMYSTHSSAYQHAGMCFYTN